jgi:hypothetical protein
MTRDVIHSSQLSTITFLRYFTVTKPKQSPPDSKARTQNNMLRTKKRMEIQKYFTTHFVPQEKAVYSLPPANASHQHIS